MLGQISGKTRSYTSARANFRLGGGARPVLGKLSGQGRGLGQIPGGCASARANFRLGAKARTRAKGLRVMEDVPAESLSLRELCITRKIACGAFPAVISFLLYSERCHSAPRYLFLLSLFHSATWGYMQKYLSFIMYYGSALLLFTRKLHCLQTF